MVISSDVSTTIRLLCAMKGAALAVRTHMKRVQGYMRALPVLLSSGVMQVAQYAEYRALWQRSTGYKWCLEERRM